MGIYWERGSGGSSPFTVRLTNNSQCRHSDPSRITASLSCISPFDFTVRYLRGEQPMPGSPPGEAGRGGGTPPVKRRMYPTKQIAVAEMRVMLEQTKALWFQAISEAGPDPSKESMLRALAAQNTVMENANAIATRAIRTCGGQAMLKTLPLERIYRDSRCGSLMLPWTAELCIDRIGRDSLYERGETDE